MTERLPFFTREGDTFAPTKAAMGYWAPNTLNGRLIGGLMAKALETAFGEEGFTPARLTVDMFRMPPLAPLTIETRLVRAGGRIKLADAELLADGVAVARASCQFLRTSENPVHPTWQGPSWSAPPPHELPDSAVRRHWDMRPIPAAYRTLARQAPSAGAQVARAASDNPPVLGKVTPFDARQVWLKEEHELVGGEPLSPFCRIGMAADYASPLSHSSEHSIDYVNSDFTLYLHRLPVGEWIGFEVVRQHATAGVAVGECWLYDQQGPIGASTAAAVAQRRKNG